MNFDGPWPGLVVSDADPTQRGCLKVRVPQVYGMDTDAEKVVDVDLPWAEPCLPFVGRDSGLVMLPEVGAGVWVLFRQGNPKHPVWLGGWLGSADLVTEHRAGYAPTPKRYVLKTPQGNLLMFSDAPEAGITLQDSAGQQIALDGSALQTRISSLGEHITTTVGGYTDTVGGNKTTTTGGNLTMLAGGNLSLLATGVTTITSLLGFTLAALAAFAVTTVGVCTFTIGAALTIMAVGTIQILGTNIILGQVASAQKLCNKSMMDLYNSHTHLYSVPQHIVSTGPTAAPTQQATEGTHTTNHVRSS